MEAYAAVNRNENPTMVQAFDPAIEWPYGGRCWQWVDWPDLESEEAEVVVIRGGGVKQGPVGEAAPVGPIPSVVRALTEGLIPILGESLVGVYLGGSTSMGDSAPSSDFDMLVVTEGALTPTVLSAIDALHDQIVRAYPDGRRLEGDYAPRALLVATGTTAPVPGFVAGRLEANPAEIMLSADNIANMRLHGIAVFGPPASEVLPEATPDDVRAAVLEMLVDGPGDCATEEVAAAGVLNLVRSLGALESGKPTTKSQGAAWGLDNVDQRWRGAIRRAVAIRAGQVVRSDDRTLREALPAMELALRSIWSGNPDGSTSSRARLGLIRYAERAP